MLWLLMCIGCLCLRLFCYVYWGCKKVECLGCIGRFKGNYYNYYFFNIFNLIKVFKIYFNIKIVENFLLVYI